ncbi:hypothetical protein CRUP_003377 [Coryphaenoides rupestris]|nr:hypothetical protein CRUP_003377 [Coryphaenoides rupestris]
MASGKKSSLLSSLAVYGDDSEPDSDIDGEDIVEDRGGGLVSASYGEDDISRVEDPEKIQSEDEESGESSRNSEMEESDEGKDADDFKEKICKLYERKLQEGFDTNNHIQKKKEFRNPSIYEKLIQFCGIDELVEMDKLEKAKKERTKIEFVTGTKKGNLPSNAAASAASNTGTAATAEAQKRKSKWDSAVPVTLAQPTLLTTTGPLPGVVSVTTTASGTKTTVISAVGTILKKAKQ